jgi:hypothetical protein
MSAALPQHWNMDALATVTFRVPKLGLAASNPRVTAVAAELHARALHHDAALTQDVFGAADHIGARYRDRRIKSLSSLTAKILRRPELGIYGAAASVSDALAYYVVFDAPVLASRYRALLMALERQGHRVVRETSYWKQGNRHKGSHVRLVSRHGMPFEIQFHIPASLAAKRLSDSLYAMYRDPTETPERRMWAEEQNLMLMGQVALPADVHLLGVPRSNPRRM